MIVTVRGSHGSGKSTCVARVLDSYAERVPVQTLGRTRPLAYACSGLGMRPVAIVGSYETPTGGCDTIGSADVIYDLVRTYAAAGRDVLFEGIVAQHSTTRLIDLASTYDVRVIVLSTTDDECVASVRARRAERGASTDEFDPRNVLKECRSVRSSTRRLEQLHGGPPVEWLDREAAFLRCLELLRLEILEPGLDVASETRQGDLRKLP